MADQKTKAEQFAALHQKGAPVVLYNAWDPGSAKVVANLGWDKVRATAPVFAGDTLYATSTVVSKRLSKSRPAQGIVTVQTTGTNQDGVVVMTFERTMLIYTRAGSPAEAANY